MTTKTMYLLNIYIIEKTDRDRTHVIQAITYKRKYTIIMKSTNSILAENKRMKNCASSVSATNAGK